jgi:hypothetical protein
MCDYAVVKHWDNIGHPSLITFAANWKVTLKYFQNVVDTVRDLMSPNADEQHYKNGMRYTIV